MNLYLQLAILPPLFLLGFVWQWSVMSVLYCILGSPLVGIHTMRARRKANRDG